VSQPPWRLADLRATSPFLVLRMGDYGQVITGQLAGWSSSILLSALAGTIWTATSTASALPSLRTRCTSPQPMSVKLSPVRFVPIMKAISAGILVSAGQRTLDPFHLGTLSSVHDVTLTSSVIVWSWCRWCLTQRCRGGLYRST